MSRITGIIGFESGQFLAEWGAIGVTASSFVNDPALARSGNYRFNNKATTPGTAKYVSVPRNSTIYLAAESFDFRVRACFKVVTLPSANHLQIVGFHGSVAPILWLEMNTAGAVRLSSTGGTTSYQGALTAGYYRADLRVHGFFMTNGKTNSARYRGTVSIYDGATDALILTIDTPDPAPGPVLFNGLACTSGLIRHASGGSSAWATVQAKVPSYFQTVAGCSPGPGCGDYMTAIDENQMGYGGACPPNPVGQAGRTVVEHGTFQDVDMSRFMATTNLQQAPTLYIGQGNEGPSCTREIDYDDIFYDFATGADAPLLEWPLGTNIHPFHPTGIGDFDQFTPGGVGNTGVTWSNVDEIAYNGGGVGYNSGGDYIRSTTVGHKNTFTHAALADPIAQVYHVRNVARVYDDIDVQALLIGAEEFDISTHDGSFNGKWAFADKHYSNAAALNAETFAALRFGLKKKTGTSFYYCELAVFEVLTGLGPAVANAGLDQAVDVADGATLNGSGSTNAASYLWEQLSGPATATIADPTAVVTPATFPVIGVYVFQLSVENSESASADTVTVTMQPGAEVAFSVDGAIRGDAIGLSWVEWRDGAGATHTASHVPLPDPASYYQGFKPARLLTWDRIRRSLSDAAGQFAGVAFGWTESDVDRTVRGLLVGAQTRYLKGQQAVVRAIGDRERRRQQTPRVLVRGFLTDVQTPAGFAARFRATDPFTQQFSMGTAVTLPKRRITRTDFPDAPDASVETPVPILYGHLSDLTADQTADLALAEAARQTVANVVGTKLAQPSAAPTSFAAALVAGGSSAVDQLAYYRLGGIDGNGYETILAGPISITPSGTNRTVRLTWVSSASAHRLYGSFREDFLQFWYVPIGDVETYDDLFANRRLTRDGGPTDNPHQIGMRMHVRYYVYAKLSATVWSQPGEAYLEFAPAMRVAVDVVSGRRRASLSWDAFPDALAYRIVRHRSYYNGWGATFDAEWNVMAATLSLVDEFDFTGVVTLPGGAGTTQQLTGVVPVRHVGSEVIDGTTYQRLLVAGHALAGPTPILQVCVSRGSGVDTSEGGREEFFEKVPAAQIGTTWLVPGESGWPFATTYRDLNGRRYTLIYTTLDPLPTAILVNTTGAEDVGDGSGEALTDVFDQWRHCETNYVRGDYQSGAYLSVPTFADDAAQPQIDEASFTAAQAVRTYQTAWALGLDGEVSVRDWIAQMCRMSGARFSPGNRHTQSMVAVFSERALLSAPEHTDVRDIVKGTFTTKEIHEEHWNVVPYVYRFNYQTGQYDGMGDVRDAASIAGYGKALIAPVLALKGIRDAVQAERLARWLLRMHRDPPRQVSYRTGIHGTSIELGEGRRVTHPEGIGPAGWTKNPVWFTGHELSPLDYAVDLDGWDVKRLVRSSFILGVRAARAADWASADDNDRAYGYLSSRATGAFADGDEGKRLIPR